MSLCLFTAFLFAIIAVSSAQTLALLDQLLKFGAERCIDEAKERIFQIKTLCDFQYSDESTMKDCGTGSCVICVFSKSNPVCCLVATAMVSGNF